MSLYSSALCVLSAAICAIQVSRKKFGMAAFAALACLVGGMIGTSQ